MVVENKRNTNRNIQINYCDNESLIYSIYAKQYHNMIYYIILLDT